VTHSTRQALFAALLAVLAGVACLLVALDDWEGEAPESSFAPRKSALTRSERRLSRPPAEEFQCLVGGLGLGPAVDLSRCGFSFDPRLCPDCPLNHEPVPGGIYFCPQHACSILYYPPLAGGQPEEAGDGRSP
jgi:hypothetical protein